jgi:hypothetical protein
MSTQMFSNGPINNGFTMQEYFGNDPDKAFQNLKDALMVLKYLSDGTITTRLLA